MDAVSLTVGRGEIYALLGANGSGASTLLRIFSTELPADVGSMTVFGIDAREQPGQARRMINVLSRVGSAAERMALMTGSARRTWPALLLLDEPTAGLDVRSRREVQTCIRDLREAHDVTVVLTTHDLDEAERLADRVAILHGGRLVAEGTPAELGARFGARGTLEEVFMTVTGRASEGADD